MTTDQYTAPPLDQEIIRSLYKKTKSHGSGGGEHDDAPLAGEASDTGEARRQFEVEAVGECTAMDRLICGCSNLLIGQQFSGEVWWI